METDIERANRIVERLMQDPERAARIQKVVADAHLFDALRHDPGWQRLYERVTSRKTRWMERVMMLFMGPKKYWPQPEEIAYYQGFYQGAVFVLAHPEHAEANLERVAQLAWAMTYEDDQLQGE